MSDAARRVRLSPGEAYACDNCFAPCTTHAWVKPHPQHHEEQARYCSPGCAMAHAQKHKTRSNPIKVQVGDRVEYDENFLRNTGQFTGDICFAKGTVLEIDRNGIATVEFENYQVQEGSNRGRVHAGNLSKAPPKRAPRTRSNPVDIAMGDRVQIRERSGMFSGRTGTVVPVPRSLEAQTRVVGYPPGMPWFGVKLDTGDSNAPKGKVVVAPGAALDRISGALYFARARQPRSNPGLVAGDKVLLDGKRKATVWGVSDDGGATGTAVSIRMHDDKTIIGVAQYRLTPVSGASPKVHRAPPRENPHSGSTKPRMYVADLAAYNAGRLKGAWVDILDDADAMRESVQAVVGEDSEWAIHDYDNFPSNFGEQPDFDEMAEVMQLIEEHGQGPVLAARDYDPSYWKSILENYRGEYDSEEAYAESLVEDMGGVTALSKETQKTYFDYASLGRDLHAEGAEEYGEMEEQEAGEAAVNEMGIEGFLESGNYFDMEAFARDMFIGDVFAMPAPHNKIYVFGNS